MVILRKLTNVYIIVIVFLVAFGFRIYKISEHPVSLSMDEVSIGYNAYSILKTGKDEWNEFLPLAFKSVGDYKPPVNIYLTVPFIAIFGLNEFAVRLPVVLLGSLSAVFFLLLLKELGLSRLGYIFGGFWFAIVPWHVHFSRASFEAVTSLFFLIIGFYLFLKSVKLKSYFTAALSISFFSLSVWAYHSQRVFVPLLIIFLIFSFWNKLNFILNEKKKLLAILILSLVFVLPFLYLTFFTKAISQRALSTSVFREQNLILALHQGDYKNSGEFVFDNDAYISAKHIVGKYLNYFDLRFWFWKGMQFTPPDFLDMGLFYSIDIFLVLTGIYLIFVRKNDLLKKASLFWFLAGPIPASFTMNEQHPLRALVWLPFFGMAASLGFEFLYKKYSKYTVLYIFVICLNVIYFGDIYFRQFPRFFSEYWQYGYKQISIFACENKDKYNNIYISETFGTLGPLNTGIPYIYTLFYCKIDPANYQLTKSTYNISVRRFKLENDTAELNTLIIGTQWDLPIDKIPESKLIKKIYYPNGQLAFIFIDTGTKHEKI